MKNLILLVILFSSINSAFSQWTFESVTNGFDDPYRIAYTTKNNNAILKLENVDGSIFFYIQGGYYCDDTPSVDIVFVVNGENIRYSITGVKSDNNNVVFFTGDLMNEEMVESFKKCSVVKIRINETYCTTETYSFNMSKSTSALTYILNKQ
jgi:hypothetical protein